MEWACAHPENFDIHTKDKINRNTHAPNFVAFTDLLQGIDMQSKIWMQDVREIVHDEQSEFGATFVRWHEIFRNAAPEIINWPGEVPFSMQRVPGSKLRIATEQTSAGLQVIDVVLWLFKRVLADKEIGEDSDRLLQCVCRKAHQTDFSFDGVYEQFSKQMEEILSADISPEWLAKAQEVLDQGEIRRQQAVANFGKDIA